MCWEIHTLKHKEDFSAYKNRWDGLNAALCDSNPYFDSDFIANLLGHFGEGRELLCMHKSGGTVDGMLIVKPDSWGKWSIFLPAQAQIGALLVKDAHLLQSLFAALPGMPWCLDCLCQDPLYGPLTRQPHGLPLIAMDHVRTVNIAIDGGFEDYWRSRPRKLRQNMGRYQRRLQTAGLDLRLGQISLPAEMPSAIQRYGMLESSGWKGRKNTAVHSENAQGKFYLDLMADFARRGKALVYELYFGDALVAMRLCVVSEHMMVMLKTAYDEQYAEYAPGRLLLHAVLANEFKQRRFSDVEFYTNANADQLAWSTHERTIQHFQAFKSPRVKAAYVLASAVRKVFSPKPRPPLAPIGGVDVDDAIGRDRAH